MVVPVPTVSYVTQHNLGRTDLRPATHISTISSRYSSTQTLQYRLELMYETPFPNRCIGYQLSIISYHEESEVLLLNPVQTLGSVTSLESNLAVREENHRTKKDNSHAEEGDNIKPWHRPPHKVETLSLQANTCQWATEANSPTRLSEVLCHIQYPCRS